MGMKLGANMAPVCIISSKNGWKLLLGLDCKWLHRKGQSGKMFSLMTKIGIIQYFKGQKCLTLLEKQLGKIHE